MLVAVDRARALEEAATMPLASGNGGRGNTQSYRGLNRCQWLRMQLLGAVTGISIGPLRETWLAPLPAGFLVTLFGTDLAWQQ